MRLAYGFLTAAPNAVVAPIHSKAIPAILTTDEKRATSGYAPYETKKGLQRPLPDNVIARGDWLRIPTGRVSPPGAEIGRAHV